MGRIIISRTILFFGMAHGVAVAAHSKCHQGAVGDDLMAMLQTKVSLTSQMGQGIKVAGKNEPKAETSSQSERARSDSNHFKQISENIMSEKWKQCMSYFIADTSCKSDDCGSQANPFQLLSRTAYSPLCKFQNLLYTDKVVGSEAGYDLLTKHYHEYLRKEGSLPKYLHRFFSGERPNSSSPDGKYGWDYYNLNQNPATVFLVRDISETSSFSVVLPSPVYHVYHATEPLVAKTLKNRDAGFGLTTWHIQNYEVDPAILAIVSNVTIGSHLKEILRTRNIFLRSFSSRNKLTSIWELKRQHISMLKNLERQIWNHLQRLYDVNSRDRVDMFFHFPAPHDHATLHLHVRVNQPLAGFGMDRAFRLDNVVAALEKDGNTHNLVMQRSVLTLGLGRRHEHFWQALFKEAGGKIRLLQDVPNPYNFNDSKLAWRKVPVESIGDSIDLRLPQLSTQ